MKELEKKLRRLEQLLKEKSWEKVGPILNQLEKENGMNKHQNRRFLLLKIKYFIKTFNYHEAKSLLDSILNDLPKINNNIIKIDYYLVSTDLEKEKGNLLLCKKYVNNVRLLLNKINYTEDTEKLVREEYLHYLEGNIYLKRGEFEFALKSFQNELKISLKLNDNFLLYYSYSYIGMVYRMWGKYQLALKNYNEALNIAENLNDINLLSQSFSILGFSYGMLGKFDLAIKYGRKAVNLARNTNQIALQSALNNLGASYWANGFLNKALNYLNEAMEITKILGNIKGLAHAYNNLGLIFFSKGDLNLALHYLKSALEIRKDLNDTEAQRYILGNIGQVYTGLGDYNNAIKYYNKGIKLYKVIEDNLQYSTLLFDLFSLLLRNGKYDDAQQTIIDLKQLSEETHEDIIVYRYQLAQGNLWSIGNNKDKKIKALEIFKSIISDEETQHEIYFLALLRLCESYIESFIEAGDSSILNSLNHYIKKILSRSEKENLFYMKNSAYLLTGKICLLQFDARNAEQIFKKVLKEAKTRGYDSLTKYALLDLESIKEYSVINQIVSKEKMEIEKNRFQNEQKLRIQNLISEITSKRIEA